MYGVREQKGMAEMEWKSAPLPAEIPTETVTFVWSGAMGSLAPGGGFAIFVNGHAAADCDVVLESAQFPCRDKACRLLYDVLYTKNGVDSAGHFFLTVPKAWVKAGRAGGPAGQGHGAGRGDLVFAGAGRGCAAGDSRSRLGPGQRGAAAAGNAATEGRRGQLRLVPQAVLAIPACSRPSACPPTRPRSAVLPAGQLERGPQQLRIGSDLSDQHHGLRAVRRRPCGADGHGRQRAAIAGRGLLAHRHHRLEPPRHRDPPAGHGGAVAGRRRTRRDWRARWPGPCSTSPTAARSRGTSRFSPPNRATTRHPKRNLSFRDGVVDGRRQCPLRPRRSRPASAWSSRRRRRATTSRTARRPQRPEAVLPAGGLYNALLVRGRIEPGQTARVAVNRVFDFPGDAVLERSCRPRWRPRN